MVSARFRTLSFQALAYQMHKCYQHPMKSLDQSPQHAINMVYQSNSKYIMIYGAAIVILYGFKHVPSILLPQAPIKWHDQSHQRYIKACAY